MELVRPAQSLPIQQNLIMGEESDRHPFRHPNSDVNPKFRQLYVNIEEIKSSEKQTQDGSAFETPNHQSSWHGEAVTPELDDWEEEVEISQSRKTAVKGYLMSAVFMLFPALYIGLALTVAVLNGRAVFSGGRGLVTLLKEDAIYWGLTQAITVSVTLFPIGFGIVLCNLLKNVAKYKAERGTRLITLEQVMASKSFGSAITAPLNFKRVNETAIFLFVLWLMSPLTTQALQRIFSTGIGTFAVVQKDVAYLNALYDAPIFFSTGDPGPVQNQVTNLFGSTLLSPMSVFESSPVDTYNNPKIPVLSDLKAQNAAKDSDGWYTLDEVLFSSFGPLKPLKTPITPQWSSFLGIPIAGLQSNTSSFAAFSNLTITTSYWTFSCSPWQAITAKQADSVHASAFGNCPTPSTLGNNSCDMEDLNTSFFIDLEAAGPDLNLTYGTRTSEAPSEYATTTCTWGVQFVDAGIICAGKSCGVVRMRSTPEMISGGASLHPLFENLSAQTNLLNRFAIQNPPMNIDDESSSGASSQLEYWILDPSTAVFDPVSAWAESYADLSKLPIDIFEQRFGIAFNTFYNVGLDPAAYVAALPESFPAWTEEASNKGTTLHATAIITEKHSIYQCHWGWFAVLLASCIVVSAVIISNAILQARVLGPDLMGYVSTMTHNNSFVPLPKGGGMISGIDRTLKLANLRVRLQDVQPQEHVGQVALASVQGKPLQRGRKYR